ncbi:uncharacterized protein LOC134688113 [Mytilus trossulus]|uniref:uncharacterized protein LOC134688113 n=1 Tax=Mytilus trossulus TaxID=6551 RepID=UPI003004A6A1
MKNVSVNTIAKMDPPSPKYSKCHAAETKKCLGSNPDDCSYLFYNFQNGRIFDGNFLIMVLVMEEENFDEVPRYIRIGNTRNFDRDSGNQRLAETQNPGDIVSTVDLNLHRRNSLRSLVESSGFNSLSLRYDDHDDSSGIGNASVQHSVLQNREFSMSFASGQPLRNTLSSGYQSGRRMHFSSGHHSFSLGSRISEINEEPNSNINHTSLNLEVNGIDISENNVLQQGALDLSNHQVSTNVISTGTRDFGGENIQSETSTITIHNTESKTRSDDHSDLSANTPSQCSRNTSLNPTPLMSSELQTPWQCPRNTNLNPAPLMNSELQTPWQCPRNTNLNPAPLMNSELQTPWQCPRNTNLNPAPLMNSELQTPWQCPRNTSFNPAPLMNSELQTPWQCPRTTNLSPAPLMNSELKTPWQCPRNTNLSPAPLMNSELQTPWQCPRNTSLNPAPLMNSELQTPWQCPRNTNLNPAPLMNSELQTPWQCPRNTSLNPAPLMNSELQTPWQCPRTTNLSPAPLMNSEKQTPWQCPRNTNLSPAPLMNSEKQTPWQCPRITILNPAPLMNSELQTPWQCPRNTNLSPAPLMNSELQTPWQCPRNTNLSPAPLMNSEKQTPWQCPRTTNLSPATLMNPEVHTPWQCPRNTSLNPVSPFEKNCVPSVESRSQQLAASVTSNKENIPADAPFAANIQTNEPEIQLNLNGAQFNSHRQFIRRNDIMGENPDYANEDKFVLPDIDDIDEDHIFGDGSTDSQELNDHVGTEEDDENQREEDSCSYDSENQNPGKDPDYEI